MFNTEESNAGLTGDHYNQPLVIRDAFIAQPSFMADRFTMSAGMGGHDPESRNVGGMTAPSNMTVNNTMPTQDYTYITTRTTLPS